MSKIGSSNFGENLGAGRSKSGREELRTQANFQFSQLASVLLEKPAARMVQLTELTN